MATVARSKTALSAEPGAPRRRRGWVMALALIVLVVSFGPWVVGLTPLRNWAAGIALSKLHGSVTIGAADLGWFSQLEFDDVEVRDDSGETLATAGTISLERNLLQLLLSPSNLGHLRIEDARLNLILRADGSNLEDVLADYLKPSEPPANLQLAAKVDLDAIVTVSDTVSRENWQLNDVKVALDFASGETTSIDVAAAAALAGAADGGRISGTLTAQTDAAATTIPPCTGRFTLQSKAVPLAMFQGALRRLVPGARLAGSLSSDLNGQWGNATSPGGTRTDADASLIVRGSVSVDQLSARATALGGDTLKLDHLDVPCQIVCRGNQLQIEKLGIDCDVAHLSLTADTPLPERQWQATANLDRWIGWLARQNYEVQGRLDVAQLAKLLPGTLRIREETEITSGQVHLSLASRAEAVGHTWQGRIDTTNLTAMSRGRQVTWEKPIAISLTAHYGMQGFAIEQLSCQSSFLALQAAGTADEWSASARCDLNQLMANTVAFVDLGEFRLAGSGEARWNWKRQSDGAFQAAASVEAQNFELAAPSRVAWTEPHLVAALNATGVAGGANSGSAGRANDPLALVGIRRIDNGSLRAEAGKESLAIELARPIENASETTTLALQARMTGDLSKWAPRLRPLVDLRGWELAGACEATLAATCSTAAVEAPQVKIMLRQVHIWGDGLFIDEPSISIETAARWDAAARRLTLDKPAVAAGTLAMNGEQIVVTMSSSGPQVIGQLACVGDVAQLQRVVFDPRQAAPWRLSGKLSGQVHVESRNGVNSATLDALVDNLQAIDARAPQQPPPGGIARAILPRNPAVAAPHLLWQERQLALKIRADYQPAADQCSIGQLEVASEALRLQGSGTIGQLSSRCELKLDGKIDYDWDKIVPMLRPFFGDGLQIAGRQSKTFSVYGPLAVENPARPGGNSVGAIWVSRLSQLTADASIGWDKASIYGLRVGPAQLHGMLAEGNARFDPLDVDVSQGRFTMTPRMRLIPPAEMPLDKGPLLRQVELTPEVCNTAIKYIAPLLAGATKTHGKFSLELDGGQIPLVDPGAAEFGGHMEIHSIEVEPGALLGELITVAKQLVAVGTLGAADSRGSNALVRVVERDVEFRMVDRRIYHRGLEIDTVGFSIRTYGSVGVDQTLAIMAEFLVKDKVIASVPVTGTLQNRRIDTRELLKNTAGALLQGELGKQLENLFRPKSKQE